MKALRRFSMALVFTLTLTLSTLAGQIDIPRTEPQPTPAPITTEGEMDTPQVAGEISTTVAADPLVEGAWGLLQLVLTLV